MEKLEPKAVWLFFFKFFAVIFFALLVMGYVFIVAAKDLDLVYISPFLKILITILIVWAIGSYILARLYYNAYKFKLTEDAFMKESGVISKKYVSIPYDRIQNVDIYRGILARILGLSDLMIQTAGYAGVSRGGGGRNPEGRVPGLSKKRAEELREELIKRGKRTRSEL